MWKGFQITNSKLHYFFILLIIFDLTIYFFLKDELLEKALNEISKSYLIQIGKLNIYEVFHV